MSRIQFSLAGREICQAQVDNSDWDSRKRRVGPRTSDSLVRVSCSRIAQFFRVFSSLFLSLLKEQFLHLHLAQTQPFSLDGRRGVSTRSSPSRGSPPLAGLNLISFLPLRFRIFCLTFFRSFYSRNKRYFGPRNSSIKYANCPDDAAEMSTRSDSRVIYIWFQVSCPTWSCA